MKTVNKHAFLETVSTPVTYSTSEKDGGEQAEFKS